MKALYTFIFVAASSMIFLSCEKKANELDHHHDHSAIHHDAEVDGHHGGGDEITLEPEVAERFGVTTDTAIRRNLGAVVKAGAIVSLASENSGVISSPTAGIITFLPGIDRGSEIKKGTAIARISAAGISGGDVNKAALIELEAAKAEYLRLEALYSDRLVTLSQYSAAKAAYEKAKAAYSAPAAAGIVKSPVSGVITNIDVANGMFVEAGAPIASVAASDKLIVRAEVPVKLYRTVAQAQDARMVFADGDNSILVSELGGKRLDAGISAASSAGYVPVTFSFRNDGTIVPGQSVELYIIAPTANEVVSVPLTALTEQQSAFFVYERIDEDCYRRIPVTTGTSDGHYIEITDGLKGGENIVVNGVTAVRLAETSGNVPEGHTHNH